MAAPPSGVVLRSGLGLLLAVVALAGCGTAATPPPAPSPAAGVAPQGATGAPERVIRVAIAHGAVSGETGRVHVALGSAVELDVTSDVPDQVHVHGYDQEVDVPAAGTATVRFVADSPGVFEVELHRSDRQLLQLEVS